MVCEEKDGERRKLPFGERERDVGVSVWPMRVYTSSFLRKSSTCTTGQYATFISRGNGTYVNLIVQCAGVYTRTIRAPADGRNWTAQLKHAHRCFWSLVTSLPDTNGTVIGAGNNKFDASPSCESSVEGINNSAVRVEFTHTLASREVCDAESMVGRDGVEGLGGEGPLEVEDGCLV